MGTSYTWEILYWNLEIGDGAKNSIQFPRIMELNHIYSSPHLYIPQKCKTQYIGAAVLRNFSSWKDNHGVTVCSNVKGEGATKTVKMLNGEVRENSKVIEGLEVSKNWFGKGNERWLRHPKSYTRMDILVYNNGIIKPDQLSQWNYLKKINKELCDKGEKIGLWQF